MDYGHVVECGAGAPLFNTDRKIVFNAGPGTLIPMRPTIPWPHAPTHQLSNRGTYFVTAGTYLKAHYFYAPQRFDVLHRGLLSVTRDFSWDLEAWAVFSNHYHFVAHSPANEEDVT